MPRVKVGDADAGRGLEGFVVINGLKERYGFLRVFHTVQGRGGIFDAPALVFARLPLGFHFLNVGAVLQHEVEQFTGGLGAEDGAGKALFDNLGQQAGVVDVGVRYKNKINGGSLVELGFAVAGLNGLVALVHAAIYAKTLARRLDHIA